jgi:hypothetical protein
MSERWVEPCIDGEAVETAEQRIRPWKPLGFQFASGFR